MRRSFGIRAGLSALLLALTAGMATGQAIKPLPRPVPAEGAAWVELPRTPAAREADAQRLQAALAKLSPERVGIVDAYVLVVALDADPVFGREAREAGRVLARRFDANGRTLVLAGDEGEARADAVGTPDHLRQALARIAERMNEAEDVLVLYTTSHGGQGSGLAWKDPARGGGVISPARLANMLGELGIRNRVLLLQACYSGQFVPVLASPTTVIATAASARRSSFGCNAGNDWSYWGDALINRAMRERAPLPAQISRANSLVAGWEAKDKLEPSEPQVSIGAQTGAWLSRLDARAPRNLGKPVGRSPAAAPAG